MPPRAPHVWTCPRCGAHLVTRNLPHSLGDVQILPQKTRLVAVARVRFVGLEPRAQGFVARSAVHRWVDSPRIVHRVDYGPGWRMHELRVGAAADLDCELRAWLQESHDTVGLQTDFPGRDRIDPDGSDLENGKEAADGPPPRDA